METSSSSLIIHVPRREQPPAGHATETIRPGLIQGQMSRRHVEFHQTLIVLEHICDVNQITKVMLAFCCPF